MIRNYEVDLTRWADGARVQILVHLNMAKDALVEYFNAGGFIVNLIKEVEA